MNELEAKGLTWRYYADGSSSTFGHLLTKVEDKRP